MDDQKSLGRLILQSGFLGGALTLYLSTIGMVETFSERYLVGNIFSLGQVLFISGTLLAGVLTARGMRKAPPSKTILASAAAGVVSSIPSLIILAIIQLFVIRPEAQEQVFRLRDMFINLTPDLAEILTFGLGPGIGAIALAIFSALVAAIGAGVFLLDERWRTSLLNAVFWILGIGIFSETVSQVLQQFVSRTVIRALFQNKALNPIAAIVIILITFVVAYFRFHRIATTRWERLPAPRKRQGRVLGIILAVGLLLILPWILGLFLSQALFMIGLYVMMGLGLNIVVGYAGLLDLGYVAFFAFGAYTMGVLTSTSELGLTDLTFWAALPICILAGVLWGLLLGFPVLRMRGDYLAIVTLGFGEIIRILFTSDWLAPIEGGPQGVLHIPNPVFFGYEMRNPQSMYYLVILGSLLAMWVTVRLRDSRLGRQWMAMREDEDVAEAMGINLVSTKLLAFAIGAAFSAMAGAIFASRLSNIFPHSLNFLWSMNALALIIVGGLGSIPGVVVGAVILVGLPEILREFAEYRLLIYGILLIVMMLVKPEGFIPEATRKRELHAGEEVFAGSSVGAAQGSED